MITVSSGGSLGASSVLGRSTKYQIASPVPTRISAMSIRNFQNSPSTRRASGIERKAAAQIRYAAKARKFTGEAKASCPWIMPT